MPLLTVTGNRPELELAAALFQRVTVLEGSVARLEVTVAAMASRLERLEGGISMGPLPR